MGLVPVGAIHLRVTLNDSSGSLWILLWWIQNWHLDTDFMGSGAYSLWEEALCLAEGGIQNDFTCVFCYSGFLSLRSQPVKTSFDRMLNI